MKYDLMARGMGLILSSGMKAEIPDRRTRKAVKREYRTVFERASDIGSGNRLLGAYCMAAFLLAMNRMDGLTPDQNGKILEDSIRNSRVYRAAMGSGESYFSEKNMESRRKWSRQTHDSTHRTEYPNDWVVDVLEKTEDYQFGFDYTQCGVCKLLQQEGHPEYAKYLCSLDFLTVDMMGIGLKRSGTLADGCSRCDFRFYRKKQDSGHHVK